MAPHRLRFHDSRRLPEPFPLIILKAPERLKDLYLVATIRPADALPSLDRAGMSGEVLPNAEFSD